MTLRPALPCLLAALTLAAPALAQTKEEIDQLAPKVVTLAKFAEGVALMENLETAPQYLVLQRLKERDPSLLEGFEKFYIEADVRDGHGVVLICAEGAKSVVFEDVGCKVEIERDVRKAPASELCTYMLSAKQVCAKKK